MLCQIWGFRWAGGFVQPTITEQRTHFGLWCALSSPLTLSLDFTNKTAIDSVGSTCALALTSGVQVACARGQFLCNATAVCRIQMIGV